MKAIKKLSLLAAMVATVAAFSAPSMAQAEPLKSKWSLGGVELIEPGANQLSGEVKLNMLSGLGGVACQGLFTLNYAPHSGEGTFNPAALNNCKYFGFIKTVCGDTATASLFGTPWIGQAYREAIQRWITAPILATFKADAPGANCPLPISITESKEVILVPNSPTVMTSFGWGGSVSTGWGKAKVEGKLTASGTNFYGIL
jgi:hypothetical protein